MDLPALRSRNPLTSFRNIFDDFFNEPFVSANRELTGFIPKVDIVEDKERYIVKADIPGMNKDDINIFVDDDILTISGEKQEEYKKDIDGYTHLERASGSFQRSFNLPKNVEKDKVNANYKNGVLELSFPKIHESEKKKSKIEIKG
ncbi:MAG: Hsp20/alpha crystallin family protein [Fibrobacter sp.]|nr:Hsp20/alpha crystallin family protein [Fibrobacter sp.]